MCDRMTKDKKTQLKNYSILVVVCLIVIAFTIYLCKCYQIYDESKKKIPVIRDTILEIVPKDLEHYILENSSTTIYMCTASDTECRQYEKKLKKLIKKEELQNSIVYLNLSDIDLDKFDEDFNKKYPYKISLTTKFPAIEVFDNSKITGLLQEKEENLSINKTKQFFELNKIGE